MRVLVTGGAGFIGSAIVYSLLSGGAEVTIIDDLSTGSIGNVHPAAGFRRVDVTDPALAGIVESVKPEVVVHLAAQVSVAESVTDPERDWRINVDGTRAVAAAALAAGARRVLLASSAAVYGEPQETPLTEESQTDPAVPYGRSKLAAEGVLAEVLRPAGVDFAALRMANVYGPRQRVEGEGGAVAQFVSRMSAGLPPVIYGTGKQTRDFIYVGDVVQAFLEAAVFEGALAGAGPSGPAYNISTGEGTSVEALAMAVRTHTRFFGAAESAPAREGDVQASVLDPGKAERVFGWRPHVDLGTGIAQTAAWFASA